MREQLAGVGPFQGLDEDTLDAIASRAMFVWIPEGQTLVRQGESGFDFYVILTGEAEVKTGTETLARLGPGDVIGEMAVIEGGKRTADVVADSAMSLMTMSAWNYRAIAEQYPAVATQLSQLATSRRAPSD